MFNTISRPVIAVLLIAIGGCSSPIEKNSTAASLLEVTKSGSVLKSAVSSGAGMQSEECSYAKERDVIQETCRSATLLFITDSDAISISASMVSEYANAGDNIRGCEGGNDYISKLRERLKLSEMYINDAVVTGIEKERFIDEIIAETIRINIIKPGSDVCFEISKTADSQFMRTISFAGVIKDEDRQKFSSIGLNEAVFWGPNVEIIADITAAMRNPVNQDGVSPIDARQPLATDETGVRPNAAPSPPRGSLSTRDMQLIGVPPNVSDDPNKPDLLRPAGWKCDGVRVAFAPDTPWGKIRVRVAGQEDLWSMSVGTQGTVSVFESSNQRFAGAQFLYEAEALAFNERPCEPAQ